MSERKQVIESKEKTMLRHLQFLSVALVLVTGPIEARVIQAPNEKAAWLEKNSVDKIDVTLRLVVSPPKGDLPPKLMLVGAVENRTDQELNIIGFTAIPTSDLEGPKDGIKLFVDGGDGKGNPPPQEVDDPNRLLLRSRTQIGKAKERLGPDQSKLEESTRLTIPVGKSATAFEFGVPSLFSQISWSWNKADLPSAGFQESDWEWAQVSYGNRELTPSPLFSGKKYDERVNEIFLWCELRHQGVVYRSNHIELHPIQYPTEFVAKTEKEETSLKGLVLKTKDLPQILVSKKKGVIQVSILGYRNEICFPLSASIKAELVKVLGEELGLKSHSESVVGSAVKRDVGSPLNDNGSARGERQSGETPAEQRNTWTSKRMFSDGSFEKMPEVDLPRQFLEYLTQQNDAGEAWGRRRDFIFDLEALSPNGNGEKVSGMKLKFERNDGVLVGSVLYKSFLFGSQVKEVGLLICDGNLKCSCFLSPAGGLERISFVDGADKAIQLNSHDDGEGFKLGSPVAFKQLLGRANRQDPAFDSRYTKALESEGQTRWPRVAMVGQTALLSSRQSNLVSTHKLGWRAARLKLAPDEESPATQKRNSDWDPLFAFPSELSFENRQRQTLPVYTNTPESRMNEHWVNLRIDNSRSWGIRKIVAVARPGSADNRKTYWVGTRLNDDVVVVFKVAEKQFGLLDELFRDARSNKATKKKGQTAFAKMADGEEKEIFLSNGLCEYLSNATNQLEKFDFDSLKFEVAYPDSKTRLLTIERETNGFFVHIAAKRAKVNTPSARTITEAEPPMMPTPLKLNVLLDPDGSVQALNFRQAYNDGYATMAPSTQIVQLGGRRNEFILYRQRDSDQFAFDRPVSLDVPASVEKVPELLRTFVYRPNDKRVITTLQSSILKCQTRTER